MKIHIETRLTGDAESLWALYTQPEHIIHWNFASEDWCCPSAENKLEAGGHYRARMEAKDKSFGFDLEMTHKQVLPAEKLSSAMPDGREVDVFFEEADGKTRIRIVFDAEKETPIEMQEAGWQAILNNFKSYAEKTLN